MTTPPESSAAQGHPNVGNVKVSLPAVGNPPASAVGFEWRDRQTYYGGEMSKFTDRIDMRFQYVPASKTDIRKTIAKELRRLAKEAEKQKTTEFTAQVKVL